MVWRSSDILKDVASALRRVAIKPENIRHARNHGGATGNLSPLVEILKKKLKVSKALLIVRKTNKLQ